MPLKPWIDGVCESAYVDGFLAATPASARWRCGRSPLSFPLPDDGFQGEATPLAGVMYRCRIILLAGACCLSAMSCRRDGTSATDKRGRGGDSGPAVEIVWGSEAKCGDREVDDFVARAVSVCASGDYEEYRLLWRYDEQPTSRKRFEQLRSSMKRVRVGTVKRLRFRQPDGQLLQEPDPMYVFHAHVEMTPEAKQRSNHRIDDRDIILQIVRQDRAWRFIPAPRIVKEAVLEAMAAPQPSPHSATLSDAEPRAPGDTD